MKLLCVKRDLGFWYGLGTLKFVCGLFGLIVFAPCEGRASTRASEVTPLQTATPANAAIGVRSIEFAWGGSGYLPFLMLVQNESQGIFPGVLKRATQKFGYKLTFRYLGPTVANDVRRKLVAGEKTRVVCSGPGTPEWTSPDVQDVLWSDPVVTTREWLYARKGQVLAAKSLNALPKGLRVATCAGYTYPKLEPLFKSHKLVRIDFSTDAGISGSPSKRPQGSQQPSPLSNVQMCDFKILQSVLKSEADVAVSNELVLGYFVKEKLIAASDLYRTSIKTETQHLRLKCSNTPATKVFLKEFNATVKQFKRDKTIDTFIEQYAQLSKDE